MIVTFGNGVRKPIRASSRWWRPSSITCCIRPTASSRTGCASASFRLRVLTQMHGKRRRLAFAVQLGELLVQVFGQKRRERRHGHGELAHGGVQRGVGGNLVRRQNLLPKTAVD